MEPGPAVVVGGASGIGAVVATLLQDAGHEVLTWDRRGSVDIRCDISDPAQIDAAVRETVDAIGTPKTATITAGVAHSGRLIDSDADDWERVVGVNAKGVWLCLRALARPMLESGGGSMVATSSVSGRLADKSMGLYCASKAALDMVVRVAAREWAPSVRVNAVAPGVTDTPMLDRRLPREGSWLSGVAGRTSMQRLGTAGDVAQVMLQLHSMSWVTGQILECDGGLGLYSPVDPPVR
jgi:NAD(P)-dependent dehydrogenase (short-subunit alcohol dehydrogenase family)